MHHGSELFTPFGFCLSLVFPCDTADCQDDNLAPNLEKTKKLIGRDTAEPFGQKAFEKPFKSDFCFPVMYVNSIWNKVGQTDVRRNELFQHTSRQSFDLQCPHREDHTHAAFAC